MNLTSFGCSITFGTELSDDGRGLVSPTPSKLTWPALVTKQLGMNYRCLARGGAGNLAIMDKLLKHRFYDPNDVFIINWTFIDRFDYSDPNGSHFNKGRAEFKTLRPSESDELSSFYFRHLHSDYRDKLTNLIHIKHTIDTLVKHQTKFFMTGLDSVMMDQIWHAPPQVIDLQESIAPYLHYFEGRNFLDWSRHKGFAITPAGHPLEAAHAAAAELMLPKIQQMLD
jgi:hypothetical protein